MQIVPPSGFGRFADARFMFKDELAKFILEISVESCGHTLKLGHELRGVVFERALGDLATQAATKHDDFE